MLLNFGVEARLKFLVLSPWLGEDRGEGTVGVVIDGDDLDGFFDAELVFLGEGGDELDVFSVFDGAGGIDDTAAGFEAGEGVGEDGGLGLGELFDVAGLESPADVDAAADHACVGAGNI